MRAAAGAGRGRAVLATALSIILASVRWQGAEAWSPDGHERIARISQELLKGKHRDQIRTMMHGDLIDLAAWEQTMRKKYPETEALQWHRQNPEWTCGGIREKASAAPSGVQQLGDKAGHLRCDEQTAESGSLFCALVFFFDHFAHEGLMNDFPEPMEPVNVPQELGALAKLPKSDLTPAAYLRWLAVLLGDLHQPLHWLKEHDYGRSVQLVYKNQSYNLLSFWEEFIPQHLPPMPSVNVLDKEYGERSPKWGFKMPTELFRDWAKETAETVCNQVYSPMEVNHADGTRTIASPFMLEEELFQRWVKLAQDFTLLGGERLAYILNDIIEHKRHKVADTHGRGIHHPVRKRKWLVNLGTNAGIAAVLVPALILLLRWHERAGGISLRQLVRGHLKT